MGNLYLSFDLPADVQPDAYYHDLDLDQAMTTTRFEVAGVTYTPTVFVSHLDQVVAIRLTASEARRLSLLVRLDSELHHSVAPGEADTLILKG